MYFRALTYITRKKSKKDKKRQTIFVKWDWKHLQSSLYLVRGIDKVSALK